MNSTKRKPASITWKLHKARWRVVLILSRHFCFNSNIMENILFLCTNCRTRYSSRYRSHGFVDILIVYLFIYLNDHVNLFTSLKRTRLKISKQFVHGRSSMACWCVVLMLSIAQTPIHICHDWKQKHFIFFSQTVVHIIHLGIGTSRLNSVENKGNNMYRVDLDAVINHSILFHVHVGLVGFPFCYDSDSLQILNIKHLLGHAPSTGILGIGNSLA